MKSPFLAFLLSFLLPGAGLAYLGKWKWGAVNLLCALVVGVALGLVLSGHILDRHGHLIAIGLGGGSGGLAQALAKQRNQQVEQNKE